MEERRFGGATLEATGATISATLPVGLDFRERRKWNRKWTKNRRQFESEEKPHRRLFHDEDDDDDNNDNDDDNIG